MREISSTPVSSPHIVYFCRILPNGEIEVGHSTEARFIDQYLGPSATRRSVTLAMSRFMESSAFALTNSSFSLLEQDVRNLADTALSDSLRESLLRKIREFDEYLQFDLRR